MSDSTQWNESALAELTERVVKNLQADAAWLLDFSGAHALLRHRTASVSALPDSPLPPWRQWPITEGDAAIWLNDLDTRFATHSWVSGAEQFRALAIAPVINQRHHPIGALVAAFKSRTEPNDRDLAVVTNLSRIAAVHLEQARSAQRRQVIEQVAQAAPAHSVTTPDGFADRVVDAMPGLFAMADTQGQLIRWNRELAQLSRRSDSELRAASLPQLLSERDREIAQQVMGTVLERGEPMTTEFEFLDGESEVLPCVAEWVPLNINSQRFVMLFAHSLAERLQSQKQIRDTRERLEMAVESSEIALWEWDLKTNTVHFTSGWSKVASNGTGEEVFAVNHPDDAPVFLKALTDTVKGDTSDFVAEYRVRTNDDSWRWIYSRGRVTVRDEKGHALRLHGSSMNIHKRKLAEERAEVLATRDSLTGLPNRQLLIDRVGHTIASAARQGSGAAFMFIDLDRFKTINDSLGHHIGDELLKRVATRLSVCVRASDTVARLGGDEFAVLIEGIAVNEVESPRLVAEKIITALSTPINIDGQLLATSCSIGVAVYPGDGRDAATLMRNADTAMYHAKDRGRNGFQFFSEEMNARAQERLAMESYLRQAVRRNELMLYYQPKFNLVTGELTGAEALLRWQHPRRGLLTPPSFISISEEIGLIVPIGEWVLERACEQLAQWREFKSDMQISVNLSVGQITNGDRLMRAVRQALDWAKLPASALDLEITESLIMQSVEEKVVLLNGLGKLGVSLSIDDFGTGYSSLAYLKRLPVDCIKIDGAFVRDIVTDLNDRAIVQAILALADSLELRTVAEGVETRQQMEALREMGCAEYQGYFASRPLPPADFEQKYFRAS
jgi:diguanylate cyclase (GGDEF)-like protein/PAS domain S-box-containing protein